MTSCWGITSGSAGMAAQVRALAAALGITPDMKNVIIKKPFVWLPNIMYALGLDAWVISHFIGRGSDSLLPPWPDLVISCGRRGAIAALGLSYLAKRQKASTRFIHIQDPHISSRHFDLVVAMEHDKISGPNVIKTRFALHAVTPSALASAASRFSAEFSLYPKPHIAVLLGGSTNKYTLTPDMMRAVIATLQRMLQSTGGSLLITPSRRTGEANIAILHNAFTGNPRCYIYNFVDENPYIGMLALADCLVVTNDSVNMMSEAHATGKPLYLLPLPGHTGTKPSHFAKRLLDDGIARLWDGVFQSWHYTVDNDMDQVVREVRQQLPRL